MQNERNLYFAIPGNIESASGGYHYNRRMIAGLKGLGWKVEHLPLQGNYPFCELEDRNKAKTIFSSLASGSLVLVDGLAFGVLPKVAKENKERLRMLALVHHPLFMETGLSPPVSEALRGLEQATLRNVRHIIVTSPQTAQTLVDAFSIPSSKIHVVLPGTDRPAQHTKPLKKRGCIRLLCVASLIPRKGQLLLLEALKGLSSLNWRLDLVGETAFDRSYTDKVIKAIHQFSLERKITIHGVVPHKELTSFYQNADIFVLPSFYEGYGMAFTEALAHELPIIASGEGAVKDTLPLGSYIYVAPNNSSELISSLRFLIQEPKARQAMAKKARDSVKLLPSWKNSAQSLAAILEDVNE
ncbi:glycosyltransferase family 4 protein [Flexibacterium corallicola]|uniref:glycosyltransferase family 4 protein n=1 Tax=Flexibacterium corallicola TaxID=3037259 RepID=UPI00286EC28F|nr:glycosyltransferase family 4 protein [Pseudovibrio sp. M1P-2-3]